VRKDKPVFLAFIFIIVVVTASVLMSKPSFIAVSKSSHGEMIGIVDVNVNAPREAKFLADWTDPNTGEPLTTANWTYSIILYFKDISSANVTLTLQYKLSSETTWTQLDTATYNDFQPSQDTYTFTDTGQESIEDHTGRLISSPEDGVTYSFDYRVICNVSALGSKSQEILTINYVSGSVGQASTKYVVPGPSISKIEKDSQGGTDVTSSLLDGSTSTNVFWQGSVGSQLTVYLYLYVSGDWSNIYFKMDMLCYEESSSTGAREALGFYVYCDGTQEYYSVGGVTLETEIIASGDDWSTYASDGLIVLKIVTSPPQSNYFPAIKIYDIYYGVGTAASWLPMFVFLPFLAVAAVVVVLHSKKLRRNLRRVLNAR